jgi:hypothetical protein
VVTGYSIPVTLLVLVAFLPDSRAAQAMRPVLLVIGLALAVAVAVYKGVLFSTTAQRGWGDARWLGGYLINSALVLGVGEALFIAIAMGRLELVAPLRAALGLLLLLNLVALALLLRDIRMPLTQARGPRVLAAIGALVVVSGILAPLALLLVHRPVALGAALLLILLGAIAVRHEMVRLPHALGQAAGGG